MNELPAGRFYIGLYGEYRISSLIFPGVPPVSTLFVLDFR